MYLYTREVSRMSLKSILLVDDSEAEQFLYKSIIEVYDSDIEVTSAYDGQEALEILNDDRFEIDAVLLDINMPRVNGFQFLDAYSQSFNKEHLIIAMVTSSSQIADKEKALAYDAVSEYFEKPLTTDNLETLSKMLAKEDA